MNKKLSRLFFGCILILSAVFITATNNHGITFPFILFPIGMIISALGFFFHGPMDPIPADKIDISIRDKAGLGLLLIGMILMISAALLKILGFSV